MMIKFIKYDSITIIIYIPLFFHENFQDPHVVFIYLRLNLFSSTI